MRGFALGVMVVGALASGAPALAAPRAVRAARAPKVALIVVPPAYVSAPRRTTPPALALRPEVSAGEWETDSSREQLSPNDLASAATTVVGARAVAEAITNRATVGKLSERSLQDAPVLTNSSLDPPLREVAPPSTDLPPGMEFFRLGAQFGFTVNQSGQN